MMHFTIDAFRPVDGGCIKCCCEPLMLLPGTVSKVSIGYAPWAAPIGRLHCSPQFQLEAKDTCPAPTGDNLPPTGTDLVQFTTAVGVQLVGDLTTIVTDPENDPLVFSLLPLYGPQHGKLVLEPDGNFTYDPAPSFQGEERFYCSVSDGVNDPIVFEVMIAVGTIPAMKATPHVSIGAPTVNERHYVTSFPVKVSPAAKTCEVWRLTVLQGALDCECICYSRSDCFDIRIVKC